MSNEKPSAELLELTVQLVHDEMKSITIGLADNARQLVFLNQELGRAQGEFTRLEKRVETLSESLLRFEKTLQKVLGS